GPVDELCESVQGLWYARVGCCRAGSGAQSGPRATYWVSNPTAKAGGLRRRYLMSVRALGARRVAAFLVDYLVIAAYIGLLAGLSVAISTALHRRLGLPRTDAEELQGHAVAFLTLTLPVVLYFALSEASPSH